MVRIKACLFVLLLLAGASAASANDCWCYAAGDSTAIKMFGGTNINFFKGEWENNACHRAQSFGYETYTEVAAFEARVSELGSNPHLHSFGGLCHYN